MDDCRLHEDGKHRWQPAGIMAQARKHMITQAIVQRPSLAMLCPCGAMANEWVPGPPEDEEGQTKPPVGGIIKPIDGRP